MTSAAEISDRVRDAASRGVALVDYGVAHEGLGNAPPPEHVRLVQQGGVIEHYQRDLTVRLEAGCTLGDAQRALREHGQFLPVDADDDLSIGELICHNVYGPLRCSYGAMRDLLLGLRFIDGGGEDIHAGGRTVKNVAGYDMTRLMVGSLGELGVVHEATLRTYAIPDQVTCAEVMLDGPAVLDSALTPWMLSDAAPAAAWLVRTDDRTWRLHVEYFGPATACAAQMEALRKLVEEWDGASLGSTANGSFDDSQARRRDARAWRRTAAALVKLVVRPAATGAVCRRLAEAAADEEAGLAIEALPVHGCVFIGGELDADAARRLDRSIDAVLKEEHGFRAWHVRPTGAEDIAPFAPAQPDVEMLARLKRTLDPHALFNPGRYLPVGEPAQTGGAAT